MHFTIRRIDYYYTGVRDEPGQAYALLTHLANLGISLDAFTAVPMGPNLTQLTMFPDDSRRLEDAARKANFVLDGPHPALLVEGDDQLGALAEIHRKLAEAQVNVYASSGVANGRGGFGYIIYVRPEDMKAAARALEI